MVEEDDNTSTNGPGYFLMRHRTQRPTVRSLDKTSMPKPAQKGGEGGGRINQALQPARTLLYIFPCGHQPGAPTSPGSGCMEAERGMAQSSDTMNNKLGILPVTIPILRFRIDLPLVCLNPRGSGGSNTLVVNPRHQHTSEYNHAGWIAWLVGGAWETVLGLVGTLG